jgi:hypothetical protein
MMAHRAITGRRVSKQKDCEMARDDFEKTKTVEGHTDIVDTSSSGGDGATVTTSPAVIHYGYCSSPSHRGTWTGPDRPVEVDAEYDCRDHNSQCDTQGGRVQFRSA